MNYILRNLLFIGVSEAYRCDGDTRLRLPGYHDLISRCRTDVSRVGVGLFNKDNMQYKIREDLSVFEQDVFESVFVEVESQSGSNLIVSVIYRPNTAPKADIDKFTPILIEIMYQINTEKNIGLVMGDMNMDLLKFHIHSKTNDYLDNIFSRGYLPVILKPTRVCASVTVGESTNNTVILFKRLFHNNLPQPMGRRLFPTRGTVSNPTTPSIYNISRCVLYTSDLTESSGVCPALLFGSTLVLEGVL